LISEATRWIVSLNIVGLVAWPVPGATDGPVGSGPPEGAPARCLLNWKQSVLHG